MRKQPRHIRTYCYSCHREDVHARVGKDSLGLRLLLSLLPIWIANLIWPYHCVTCGQRRPRHRVTAGLLAKLMSL